jgi:Domain of Unknown Function (DUF1080)
MQRHHFLLGFALLATMAFKDHAAYRTPSPEGWHALFNGKDFSGWDTYLAPPADSTGKRISDQPIGLDKDPHRVFSVIRDNDQNVIRISGEDVGGLISKKEYADYHLQVLFKWGILTWGQKKGKKKDSGLLYHSVGPYGADWGAWMRSHEFQIQQGDCGDYWGCAGGTADIPAVRKSDSEYVYTPSGQLFSFRADNAIGRHCIKSSDAEKPAGEWNTLDLYCHGDTSIQVVNGVLMMILFHLGQVDNGKIQPLTSGRIQLQSEGAEVLYKGIRIRPIDHIPESFLSANH